jgi:uncharacterized RDD family membrane protein YckC
MIGRAGSTDGPDWETWMEDDRRPAEKPEGDAAPPPPSTPVVSWGPPPGTTAPVPWAVVEASRPPPPIGTVYAGVGIRFVALILDLVPLIALGVIMVGPVFADMYQTLIDALPDRVLPGRTSFPEMQAALEEMMSGALPGLTRASVLFQLGGTLYFAGSWLAFSRTPAMALVGLRIVREEDGGRLDLARVAIRYGGYLLSAAPLLLGFAWAIFDNRNQAWHDKLAGTLVVRAAPSPVAPAPVEPVAVSADDGAPAPESMPRRRPSVGAVAEAALRTFRRAPLDLFASLAIALIPVMIVVLPLIALYQVAGQDQAVLSLKFIGDAFNVGTDTASLAEFLEYNRRIVAATAPLVLVGALTGLLGSIAGSLLVGACAAAVDDEGSVRPAGAVARAVVDRLPALLMLGVSGGLALAFGSIVVGLPSLSAASADPSTFDPNRATLAAVLGALGILPLSIYFSAIWVLAVVCVVRERLPATAALRRAWVLSRGRMRWLVGVVLATGLGAYAILGPVGAIPIGLLAEDYFAGGRLGAAISVVILGVLALVAAPIIGLTYVEAYAAARDDARGPDR